MYYNCNRAEKNCVQVGHFCQGEKVVPKCSKCGKWGIFLTLNNEGLCTTCAEIVRQEAIEERNRLEKERMEKQRIEQQAQEEALLHRLQEKETAYREMVSKIRPVAISISSDLAPIILSKDQTPVTYSSITKKTPRDRLGNFVVVDVETTGLRPSSCEIIDIAAIKFRNFEPVEKFCTLLSPKKSIPEETIKIHHITDEMVAGQPRFQQIAQSLLMFIGEDNIVGHNLPFDLSFIIRYGADVTKKERKYYDTLQIAQKTVKKQKYKWDKDIYGYVVNDNCLGVDNYKLGTLCQWYGIMNPASHRAEGDALATGLLFKKLSDDRM